MRSKISHISRDLMNIVLLAYYCFIQLCLLLLQIVNLLVGDFALLGQLSFDNLLKLFPVGAALNFDRVSKPGWHFLWKG